MPVTRIEFWCNGWDEWIENLGSMDVEQQVDDVRLDADHQKLDYDELDTQREDWLLLTESLHRTRPRWIIREYRRRPEYEHFFRRIK